MCPLALGSQTSEAARALKQYSKVQYNIVQSLFFLILFPMHFDTHRGMNTSLPTGPGLWERPKGETPSNILEQRLVPSSEKWRTRRCVSDISICASAWLSWKPLCVCVYIYISIQPAAACASACMHVYMWQRPAKVRPSVGCILASTICSGASRPDLVRLTASFSDSGRQLA